MKLFHGYKKFPGIKSRIQDVRQIFPVIPQLRLFMKRGLLKVTFTLKYINIVQRGVLCNIICHITSLYSGKLLVKAPQASKPVIAVKHNRREQDFCSAGLDMQKNNSSLKKSMHLLFHLLLWFLLSHLGSDSVVCFIFPYLLQMQKVVFNLHVKQNTSCHL